MENQHPSVSPPACSTSVPGTPTMSPQQLRSDMDTIRAVLSERSADKGPHRHIIAGGNVFCGLMLVVAIPFILLGTGIPAMIVPHDQGGFIPLVIGLVVSAFLVALSLPFFLAAWGLFKNKTWGTVAAVVAAVLNLMNVPLGMALSIYTFWALAKNKLA